jgi:hypothetical protein
MVFRSESQELDWYLRVAIPVKLHAAARSQAVSFN